MLAASPASIALAQNAPVPLPPVVVEADKAKKKKKAKAAAKPSPQATTSAEPTPQAAVPTGQPPGSFKVDRLSSGKSTAPLLDTPQTVTVVPGTIIEQRGATNLTEVLSNTPGITFSAGENAFSSGTNNFQLRGFDTSGSIFIDGFRDSGSYARDTFNVDRIEVIKGPAADNGRGTAGGYINIVTKTPVQENFVRSAASIAFDEYDSEARFRSTVDINQFSGTTAVRLNGMIEEGGVAGRDVAEANAWGIAPSVAFGLGTDTRLTLSYEHLERNDLPDWGVPTAMMKGIFRFHPAAAKASRDNFYGLYSDFDDVRADAVVARLEHDLSPNFTISNTTRFSETDRQARFTYPNGTNFVPGNPPPLNGTVVTVHQFYDRENTSLGNQTNLSGKFYTGPFRHKISTGIEFSREEADALAQGNVANVGGQPDIYNPNPGRDPGRAFNPTERSNVEVKTAAAYLFDTMAITK